MFLLYQLRFMKIVCDDKIPFLPGVLEPFFEVIYQPGADTTSSDVADASAMITRTRTTCNEKLLKNSLVKVIATATVGFDHIDTHYCESNGIHWENAPGCNSGSVLQWVAASLAMLSRDGVVLAGKKIAVVGVGHVGKKVEKLCQQLDMEVLAVDPLRAIDEHHAHFWNYDDAVAQADIITYHTPLTFEGAYATHHMLHKETISSFKPGVVVLNASRGEVVDTRSLIDGLDKGIISRAIIDVWENEPLINAELLEKAWIATPHIAGYSLDSKYIGTSMAVDCISRYFGLDIPEPDSSYMPDPECKVLILSDKCSKEQAIAELILHTYPIRNDDRRLRQSPATFEYQRGHYPVRREFGAYTVVCEPEQAAWIESFGFKTSH